MQVAAGSKGITSQKLGEAEAMVDGGLDDILIPYNIVGKPKLQRLTQLVKQAKITVALDSEITAEGISGQAVADDCIVRVVIEQDTGGRRVGAQSPQATLELAQRVTKMPGLDFQGIMTYGSNIRAKPFIDETVNLLKWCRYSYQYHQWRRDRRRTGIKRYWLHGNTQWLVCLRRYDAHFWLRGTQSGALRLADDRDGCEHPDR